METNHPDKQKIQCLKCGEYVKSDWIICPKCQNKLIIDKKTHEIYDTDEEKSDVNYRWRVFGSIGLVAAFVVGIVLTVTFSSALTANTIVVLYCFLFMLVVFITIFIFSRPLKSKSRFNMNNPLIALLIAIIAGLILFFFTTNIIKK